MGRRSGNATPPQAEGSDGPDDNQTGKLRNTFMSRFRGGKSKSKSSRKTDTKLESTRSSDDSATGAFVGDFPDFDELGLEPRKLDELAKHALSGNASFVAEMMNRETSGNADGGAGANTLPMNEMTEDEDWETRLEKPDETESARAIDTDLGGAVADDETHFNYIRVMDQFLPPPHSAAVQIPHFCYIDVVDAAHAQEARE